MTLLFFLIITFLCHGEGFAPETLVKTTFGYRTIESLQVNDLLICCDIKTNTDHIRPVIALQRTHQNSYFTRFQSCSTIIGHDQLIYLPELDEWIPIQQFLDRKYLSSQNLVIKVIPFKSETLISLSVADFHNFYITEDDILVHNFVPAVFVAASAVESLIPIIASSGVFATCMTYLGIEAFREHKKKKQVQLPEDNGPSVAAGGAGRPPDDPNDPFKNKDKERFNRRDPDHHITNKEAREVAAELGYVYAKNPPFNTHGQIAFKKGSLYITPDNTAHKGGYWKLVKVIGTTVTRLGTYDKSLKTKIGT